MRTRQAIAVAIGLSLLAPTFARAADQPAASSSADEKDPIDAAFEQVEQNIDRAMSEVDAQWEAMAAAEEARWNALQREVEAKWDAFVGSTKTEWVDYSTDRDVRSRVDYQNGQVVVEVLIRADAVKVPPKPEPVPVELPPGAVAKIEQQVEKIAKPDPEAPMGPVEDQVRTAAGQPLTEENAKQFVDREVVPKAVVDPHVIKGKDGVERRKATVVIPMIPEHLYVRAAKFRELVTEEAAKYDMEPQLVFAVIQTESYFNPKARSPAMAFGLMQLIPRYAAYEAIEYLEGKGRLVEPDYLYVPENNVRLGAAYLHLLDTRYYGTVEDRHKREILVVASYNWGPTAVRRKVVDKVPVETLTAEDLRREVDRRVPQETRDYVERVTTRKPIYNGLVLAEGSR